MVVVQDATVFERYEKGAVTSAGAVVFELAYVELLVGWHWPKLAVREFEIVTAEAHPIERGTRRDLTVRPFGSLRDSAQSYP